MISAVVLAAGASSRMGEHKLLLPLGGEPLVRRVTRTVLQAGFDDVLLVVGFEYQRVLDALEGLDVRHAINLQYSTGMGSSFRTAVAALPDSDAAMFALADQPLLESPNYRRVLDEYVAGKSSHPDEGQYPGIVSVRYGEVTAPPHLFDRRYFAELSQLEHGARPILQRHADDTVILQFPPDLLLDIDTPDDYERARARFDRT